tara:strand:+ start:213 stop:707 length:495 start_codon:yes stop_codon:yes gene_type:complete
MKLILFLILIIFCVIFLITKKKEYFSNEFFDKLCLDDYYSCLNYKKCCSRDNYLKLGHAKHCNNVKNSNSCTSFKKKNIIKNSISNYNEYRSGYSYIPFYNWDRRKNPLCYTDSSIIPNNIIESKLVYSAKKIDNIKVKKNEEEYVDDDIKSKLSTYKKFINNL